MKVVNAAPSSSSPSLITCIRTTWPGFMTSWILYLFIQMKILPPLLNLFSVSSFFIVSFSLSLLSSLFISLGSLGSSCLSLSWLVSKFLFFKFSLIFSSATLIFLCLQVELGSSLIEYHWMLKNHVFPFQNW